MRRMIDSALEGQGQYKGKVYFTYREHYVRYDWDLDRVDPGFPLNLSLWFLQGDFAKGVDAALNGGKGYTGKLYFFRNNQYVRYDWRQNRLDPDYPQPLSAWKFPDTFNAGVDSSINGGGPYVGKAYIFKGNQYLRYDWQKDIPDPDYPQPISLWNFPSDFVTGFDAALNGIGPQAEKAYFFKGSDYIRYDWASGIVDSGYPRHITSNWKGVCELLCAGAGKTQALTWLKVAVLNDLQQYLNWMQQTIATPPANISLLEMALQTHFHIDRSNALTYLPGIARNYKLAIDALHNSASSFRFRTREEAIADRAVSNTGEIYIAYGIYNNSINFTERFVPFGPLCQAAMVLHESVHYIDSKATRENDFYEHGAEYPTITADQALHNPSSYVAFAQHLAYKKDERYGAGRPNE